MSQLSAFLEGAVRTATPLALAALGEVVAERAGVINIGLEGIILAGAFGALLGAGGGNVMEGFAAGCAAGVIVAALFAFFAVQLATEQIVTGTAVNLFSLGMTGALYRGLYGTTGAALSIPTAGATPIPGLSEIPLLGTAFFNQPAMTYALYLLVPGLWWWMYRTHAGLALRAVGERPEAAIVAGAAPRRIRWLALLFGGLMGGAAGGTLVLAQAGTFAEGMSAGRGFIAIAIVVLGRWHPVGAALAALLFGGASALQYLAQAMAWTLPYQLFLALPYIVTLLALVQVGQTRSGAAPASLGRA